MPKPALAARLALATAQLPVSDPMATLADELGDLDKELAPFKTKIARRDEVKKTLREQYALKPAQETFTINGTRWIVILGLKGNDSPIGAHIRKGSREVTILPNLPAKPKAA